MNQVEDVISNEKDKKESFIHFSSEDIKSLINNKKTLHVVPFKHEVPEWITQFYFSALSKGKISGRGSDSPVEKFFKLSYGDVGDILWVKEQFSMDGKQFYPFSTITYAADNEIMSIDFIEPNRIKIGKEEFDFKWQPSARMPKRFSRFKLTIKSLSVKRIQEITDEEIEKTGVSPGTLDDDSYMSDDNETTGYFSPKSQYDGFVIDWCIKRNTFFNKGNNLKAWEDNPFVWVIEFEVEKVHAPRAV